ncbi:MAG: hypothetical protein ABI747_03825 [Candidatus Moraniibacteriota bacterium]
MTGINLSQSLQDKQAQAHGTFFDKSFFVNLVILVVIVSVFGGVRYYLSVLEKEKLSLEEQFAQKAVALRGDNVDRVADLRDRLDIITENLKKEPKPAKIFSMVEGVIIPEVRLTSYQVNWQDSAMELSGVTESLKFVSLQMIALKTIPEFTKVAVKGLQYNKEGKLEFSLTIMAVQPAE